MKCTRSSSTFRRRSAASATGGATAKYPKRRWTGWFGSSSRLRSKKALRKSPWSGRKKKESGVRSQESGEKRPQGHSDFWLLAPPARPSVWRGAVAGFFWFSKRLAALGLFPALQAVVVITRGDGSQRLVVERGQSHPFAQFLPEPMQGLQLGRQSRKAAV